LEFLQQLFPELTRGQIGVHGFIFIANIALFFLARPILTLIDRGNVNSTKVSIFRFLNILVFGLHVLDLVLIRANSQYQHYFINIGYSIMVIYGALLIYSLLAAQSKRRFGKERTLDGKPIYLQTYSSRMIDLVMLIAIVLTVIYILILIWNAQPFFAGIYAVLAAFFAFTSGIWAPDIVSGLIILNTEILEDGDVIVMDGHKNEYVIGRVTLIYIVLYDIRNNHRTLMRNSLFTQRRIDNLSRVTSSSGIRQGLLYKIGYPQFSGDKTARVEQLAEFENSIGDMFEAANERCIADEDIMINSSKPFDWAMTNAGDFALEYMLWIYLDKIPNTKVTSTIRKHLMGTIYKVNEAVYRESIAENIDLSTPEVHQHLTAAPARYVSENKKQRIQHIENSKMIEDAVNDKLTS